jgi:SAM-dependent MidA family methyltransferase
LKTTTRCAFDPITFMSQTEFIIQLGHFHLHEACNPKTDRETRIMIIWSTINPRWFLATDKNS